MTYRMAKFKYEAEYEFDTSLKVIYPYLMPKGLEKWLAEEVVVKDESNKIYTIVWDDEPHEARLTRKRTNRCLRYLFLSENGENEEDLNYLDFQLNLNEMTETIFLQITDYSDMDDTAELQEVWDSLMNNLRYSLRNRSKGA